MPNPHRYSCAFLAHGNERYGTATVVRVLAAGLAERGERASVICIHDGSLADECRGRGWQTSVLGLPTPPPIGAHPAKLLTALPAYLRWQGQARRAIAERLRDQGGPPLVIQWPSDLQAAGAAAKLAGVGCYWVMPNIVSDRWPFGVNRRLYRLMLRRYGVVALPNSRYTGRTLGSGFEAQALHLGADAKRFDPGAVRPVERSDLGLPLGRTVLGVFSRIDASKGQERLWEAMLRWIERGEDLGLLVVGGPEESPVADRMRDRAERSAAGDRLVFTGWSTEPERYYGAIDVAVNSRLDPEPFGLSVIEAMLMGKPILVHALGGPAETVLDNVTGWHLTDPTIAGFEAALGRVIADRDRWSDMGVRARAHASTNYSTEAFVERFLARIKLG